MDRSPLLERHQAGGARLADRPEAPGFAAPLTFGDVPAEYFAGRSGCALLDASDRGRVTLTGKDAPEFLHRLLANPVRTLPVEGANRNLLLSPKGKVLFDFDLVRWEERIELSAAPGRAAALRQALEVYHFSEDVRFELDGERHAPLELCGPGAGARLAALGLEPPAPGRARRARWNGAELVLSAPEVAGARGLRLDVGPEHVPDLWDALVRAGARPCGLVARDSLRVEAGAALAGVDVDENVYPQEAGLERAFALDKGCYVGQEVVAKIDTYGGLNKRLLGLRVDHSDPVARGTALVLEHEGERRELGLVTSWAYSFALDTGLVLGYVKRHHQEPGTRFDLGGGQGHATVVELPVALPAP